MNRIFPAALVLVALLSAAPPPAVAQQAPQAVIVVAGEGTAEAAPDLALLEVGVEVQRPTAAEAQRQAAAAVQRIIARLTALGIPRNRIETASISLVPIRRPPREGQAETVVAYQATNMLRVTVEQLARTGEVIDAAVGAGANQLGGVLFTLRDSSRARAQALELAVRDARAKAETIARAAGVTLGAIARIEEGAAEVQPRRFEARDMAVAATPVLPGAVRVRATVTITYRF